MVDDDTSDREPGSSRRRFLATASAAGVLPLPRPDQGREKGGHDDRGQGRDRHRLRTALRRVQGQHGGIRHLRPDRALAQEEDADYGAYLVCGDGTTHPLTITSDTAPFTVVLNGDTYEIELSPRQRRAVDWHRARVERRLAREPLGRDPNRGGR